MIGKIGTKWLEQVNWDKNDLVPAIAQDYKTGRVLTLAWMNHEALTQTVNSGKAVYWSRSRKKLWQKGETSGHWQIVKEIFLDCDNDTLLLKVEQVKGIACHTGRESCFFQRLEGSQWKSSDPIIKDPEEIYGKLDK